MLLKRAEKEQNLSIDDDPSSCLGELVSELLIVPTIGRILLQEVIKCRIWNLNLRVIIKRSYKFN